MSPVAKEGCGVRRDGLPDLRSIADSIGSSSQRLVDCGSILRLSDLPLTEPLIAASESTPQAVPQRTKGAT